MPSKTPHPLIDTLRTYFVENHAPTTALGNAISLFSQLPGLRCYWPMSAQDGSSASDIVNGYDLTNSGVQFTSYGLSPVGFFNSGGPDYLYHADNAQFDIIGTEVYQGAASRGLCIGGWFRPTVLGAVARGLMGKWVSSDPNRSYLLYLDASGVVTFSVSDDGTAAGTDTVAGTTLSINNWYFIVGNWSPANDVIDLWINNTKYSAASDTVDIQNTTTQFEVGRWQTNYYDGHMAHCFLSAMYVPDLIVRSLYHHTRAMYGR